MFSGNDPSIAEGMVHDLGLNPGLSTRIDAPLTESLLRIDDEAFEREFRAHPERYLHREVTTIEDFEQAVRERAYEIWEREGRPDGQDNEIWLAAERQIRTAERIRRENPI